MSSYFQLKESENLELKKDREKVGETLTQNQEVILRTYPKSPAALKVIHAHAKCSIAR